MNANTLMNTSEISWLVSKSSMQIDGDGNFISGSSCFKGMMPYRMVSSIRRSLKEAGAKKNGNTYSVSSGDTESDYSVTVSFGQRMSNQNRICFNVSPYTW
jgi:hypothetical protein